MLHSVALQTQPVTPQHLSYLLHKPAGDCNQFPRVAERFPLQAVLVKVLRHLRQQL